MGGCTEELQLETSGTNGAGLDEGELTEAVLNLSVNTFAVEAQAKTRASLPSDTPEKETSEEKEIHNIWVFQYDATTKELLIKPRYYTIADQAMLQDLPVYLKAGVPSIGIDTLSIDRKGKAVGRVCFFSCSRFLNFCHEVSVPSLAQLS